VVDKPEESTAQVPRKTRTRQPKADKNRASEAVHDSDDRGLRSKAHNTRRRKIYKQERGSRKLAGHLPEYSMLPKQDEPAPPYEPPSNVRKPNPSGPGSRASSKKKSIAVKGAKPQGSSKSWAQGDESSEDIQEGIRGLRTYKLDGCLTPLRVYTQLLVDSATVWPIHCVGIWQNASTNERASPPSDEHIACCQMAEVTTYQHNL